MDTESPVYYYYYYDPAPTVEAPSVMSGWVVIHDGGPGAATAVRAGLLFDEDGSGTVVPMGDPESVTVSFD